MHDRLQFSIRSMLLLTALFAVLLVVFLCKPSATSVLARFIVGFFLMSLAISAVYITAGVARVFWTGVAAPLAMSAMWISLILPSTYWGWNNEYYLAAEMGAVWRTYANELNVIPISCCLALINGLLCALVYRQIGPQRGPVSVPHLTFRLFGFFWLTAALVAIAFFLGGMMFDSWSAAPESSDDEPANTSLFRSNDDNALEGSKEADESMPRIGHPAPKSRPPETSL